MDKRGQMGYSSWGCKDSGMTEHAHMYYTLVVQWLRLHRANAGGLSSMPSQGTRSYMLQLKDPSCSDLKKHPATKAWCSQINKINIKTSFS